jgi:hypothetical protein
MDVSKGSMKQRGRSSVSRLPPSNQLQRSASMSCMARVRAPEGLERPRAGGAKAGR